MSERCSHTLAVLVALVTAGAADVSTRPPLPDLAGVEPQVAAAIRQADQRVAAAPEDAGAWAGLARVLYAHAFPADAVRSFERAAELAQRDHRWPYLIARASELTDIEAALAHARRAAGLAPDYAPGHVLAGRLEEQRGDPEAAANDYRRALEADPGCAAAEFGLGRLLLVGGDVKGAVARLERARDLQPGSGSVRAFLARAYGRLGRRDEAAAEASRGRTLPAEVALDDPVREWVDDAAVSTTGLQARAARAERRGDVEEAVSFYRRLVELHPDEAVMQYNLGNLLFRHGRLGEAEPHLRLALLLNPEHVRAHLVLGGVLLSSGRMSEAREHFDRPVPLSREHAHYLAGLGRGLLDDEQLDLAGYFLRRALELDPRDVDAHQLYGRLLTRQGRLDDAVAHYETAAEIRPSSGGVRVDLAMALALSGDHAAAWEQIAEARARDTQPPADFLDWLRQQMPEPDPAPPWPD